MWRLSKDGRVDKLVVFKWFGDGYVPAGELSFEGAGRRRIGRFVYAASYLARDGRSPLDPVNLPLGKGSRPAAPEEAHLVFHDSGPDGWGKSILEQAFPHLDLGMGEFLALGGLRRTGDLAYGPTPEGPATWKPARAPLIVLPEEDDDLEALLAAAEAVDGGERSPHHLALLVRASADLGGARPKARLRHGGRDRIVKFPTWGDKFNDPKMEAVCLDIAAEAGIETPHHEIVTVAGKSVLVIDRFDRTADGQPLAYLSASTLLGVSSTDYSTTKTYVDIAEVGRRIGAIGTASEMYRRYLLNSHIRNTDDHLRNHAYIANEGVWRLSPVFDVVPHPGTLRHVCAAGPHIAPNWDPQAAFGAFEAFGIDKSIAEEAHESVMRAFGSMKSIMEAREVSAADQALITEALFP